MHFDALNQSQSRCQYWQSKLISVHRGGTSKWGGISKATDCAFARQTRSSSSSSRNNIKDRKNICICKHRSRGVDNTTTTAAAPQQVKEPSQSSMQIFVRTPIQPLQQFKVDEAPIKTIAMDFHQFSIVEDRGFGTYTNALDRTCVLPSRGTVSKTICCQTCMRRSEQSSRINTVPAVCLKRQMTAGHQTPPLATCLWLAIIFRNANYIPLDFFVVTEQHKEDNLAQELSSVAHENCCLYYW